MLSKILYILLALLILLLLITVHEFGHYIAGKIFKFKINEFSIGFGKAIYKKTKKDGEVFSIRALPLGGYCAFEGEDEDGKDNPEAFNSKPAWKRLIVLFGGVFFNFMFGIITSAIYLMVAGYSLPVISNVRTHAELQGLQIGDKIVAVEHQNLEAYRALSDVLSANSNKDTILLTVERNGEKVDVEIEKENITDGYFYVYDQTKIINNIYIYEGGEYIQLKKTETEDTFILFSQDVFNANISVDGDKKTPNLSRTYYYKYQETDQDGNVVYEDYIIYTTSKLLNDNIIAFASPGKSLGITFHFVGERYGFFECLLKAWPFGFYICKVILGAFGGLFTGATKISDLGGTITTISTIATYSAMNPLIILYLFPMLSFNLAIFNALPIPALDGSRIVFVLWEAITRKPVNRKVEGWIHTIGLFVLLGLVLFLDIYHFFV